MLMSLCWGSHASLSSRKEGTVQYSKLRPRKSQLSSKTSGRSWHFPTSCLVFPSHALAYLQAFKLLKGRAGLYYASGQRLIQEGPSLIRVSCDYRNTNTANRTHLNQKKGRDASFPVSFFLGKCWESWDSQPEAGWPNLTHPGMDNPLSCPCSVANQTVLACTMPPLCLECFAHPNVPHICLPKAGPASVNSN